MVRAALVVVVIGVLAGRADAQAPGEATQPEPPPTDPAQPPPPPVPEAQPPPAEPPTSPPGAMPGAQLQPAPPQSSVMDRRWSIGAGIGWAGFTAETEAKEKVVFGILEVAGRYRFAPAMEIALALVAGGAEGGDLTHGGLYADFRYRFRAERRWNPYVFGGLGVASVAAKDATEAEKAGRGSLRGAFGIERRGTMLGFYAEVRLTGIAENKKAEHLMLTTPAFVFERRAISGGSVVFGVNIYL